MPLDTGGDRELIHDPAGHADEVVLRSLAHQSQFRDRETGAGEAVERHGHGHFQGGRRGESGTVGDVALDPHIHPGNLDSPCAERGGHGDEVVGPVPLLDGLGGIDVGDDLPDLRKIHRGGDQRPIITDPDPHVGAPVDGHGQHGAAHVVDVVADEVHSARRVEVAHPPYLTHRDGH